MGQSNTIRILDGNTFVVCEDTGDIEATPSEPTDTTENKQSTPKLTVVKAPDTTEQQTAVENEKTTPVTKPESTADDKKADDKKADHKKSDEAKAVTDTKPHSDKKSETAKNPKTENKDADSAKAAA